MELLYFSISYPLEVAPAAALLTRRLERLGLPCRTGSAQANLILRLDRHLEAETCLISAEKSAVVIEASTKRGMVFGVGRLLRTANMRDRRLTLPENFHEQSVPCFPLRGMQIGYRALSNTNDTWTKAQYTEYVEDLAIFGANAIEILPDDENDGVEPLMRYPVAEMNAHICHVCMDLGLDVWYWLPHQGRFMDTDEGFQAMMASVEEKLTALPCLHAVFIPGADPGDLEPEELFRFAQAVAACARRLHPQAGLWLSPQVSAYTPQRLQRFYDLLKQRPAWLTGIVFGPWERDDPFTLRRQVPDCYPIRHYPDISHSFHCQYPVPQWDPAFALTLGRECVNPRPKGMKHIHHLYRNCFIGSIGYSDGFHDDLNKMIWLDQEWNPETPAEKTVGEYARLWIGAEYAERFSTAIFLLEENLSRPVADNPRIPEALALLEALAAEGNLEFNARFQLHLLRARYDACLQSKLIASQRLEAQARAILAAADVRNARACARQAVSILTEAVNSPESARLEALAWETAEKLYALVGLQSSVSKYHAPRWMRAAFMDGLALPLHDGPWLSRALTGVLTEADDQAAYGRLCAIRDRCKPLPGGLYRRLDGTHPLPELLTPHEPWDDPACVHSAFLDFSVDAISRYYERGKGDILPLSWLSGMTTLFDTPLRLHFEGLPAGEALQLRIVYFFSKKSPLLQLEVNQTIIQPYRSFTMAEREQIYPLPASLNPEGSVELCLTAMESTVGAGICELWITPARSVRNANNAVNCMV